jgi:hypothetical protein
MSPQRPSAHSIALRAAALTLYASRIVLECELRDRSISRESAAAESRALIGFIRHGEIAAAFTSHERSVLTAPAGALRGDVIDLGCVFEHSIQPLLWAIGACDDVGEFDITSQFDPGGIIGIRLDDRTCVSQFLDSVLARPAADIDTAAAESACWLVRMHLPLAMRARKCGARAVPLISIDQFVANVETMRHALHTVSGDLAVLERPYRDLEGADLADVHAWTLGRHIAFEWLRGRRSWPSPGSIGTLADEASSYAASIVLVGGNESALEG